MSTAGKSNALLILSWLLTYYVISAIDIIDKQLSETPSIEPLVRYIGHMAEQPSEQISVLMVPNESRCVCLFSTLYKDSDTLIGHHP